MKKILIMNGPNLNLLGEREPNIYGNETLNTINDDLDEKARKLGYEPVFFQSNSEGGLIDRLHESRLDCAGVILNAGAYTHYSYAILDALKAVDLPAVEVHISNIHKRDEFRHKSVTAPACVGQICGLGFRGYALAIDFLIEYLSKNEVENDD